MIQHDRHQAIGHAHNHRVPSRELIALISAMSALT
jgi:hypothetical protein